MEVSATGFARLLNSTYALPTKKVSLVVQVTKTTIHSLDAFTACMSTQEVAIDRGNTISSRCGKDRGHKQKILPMAQQSFAKLLQKCFNVHFEQKALWLHWVLGTEGRARLTDRLMSHVTR